MNRPRVLHAFCRVAIITALGWVAHSGFDEVFAANPVDYRVSFTPSGDKELDGLLKVTSALVSLEKKLPAAPFALIGRARADQAQFIVVLHSLGYDAGSVSITVNGKKLTDASLLDTLTNAPEKPAVEVKVTANKGPLYHLNQVVFATLPPGFVQQTGIAPGQVARAQPILTETPLMVTMLHNAGYAFATVSAPFAVADDATHSLNVSYTVMPGPHVDIGAISFDGLTRTDPDFLRRHIALRPGQAFSDRGLSGARDSLLGLGVFSSVTPVPATVENPPGQAPIAFRVVEQKRHAVSLGGSYATDTGFSISASWEDRNVFRRAETLTISATASGLGGAATTAPGYDLKGVFAKPDYYRRGQTLNLTLEALKQSLNAYNQTALLASGILSRPITPHLTFTYGLGFVTENIQQEGISSNYVLLQVPLALIYDTTNSLLEPTKGIRTTVSVTPTQPLAGNASDYFILQVSGSTYIPVERDARGVFALRAEVGTIQGASQFQVPPDQRFYAGGSATVRGYTYQTVGPLFADDNPEGGTAIDAGTIEFRQRVYGNFGIVPFVDVGQVSAGSRPFQGTLAIGAGLGARYYTGIGPIRVDFAVPVKNAPGSGSFALYIGLGEAF